MSGTCSEHGRYEKCKTFLSENLKGRNHLQDLGVDVKIIVKVALKKQVSRVLTRFN
jgi:hypothetical protein